MYKIGLTACGLLLLLLNSRAEHINNDTAEKYPHMPAGIKTRFSLLFSMAFLKLNKLHVLSAPCFLKLHY